MKWIFQWMAPLCLGTLITSHALAVDAWHIRKNYETLPCLSLAQTQALKQARAEGPEAIINHSDIFYEKTKAFFSKYDRFICPPIVEKDKESDSLNPYPLKFGTVNNYELIHVNQWQMEVLEGSQQKMIWKMKFDPDTGVARGKVRPFILAPLSPKDSEESPYMIHALKIKDNQWQVHVCYPVEKHEQCNPYKENKDATFANTEFEVH